MFDNIHYPGQYRQAITNQFAKVQASQEKYNQIEKRCVFELIEQG
jgi:hypothetical protein